MATLASTQITASNFGAPFPLAGGLLLEVWRVAGGAVDDTIAITPSRGRFVVAAMSSIATSDNVSTLGTSTNVTLTLLASAATSVTSQVWLIVQS